MWRVSIAVLDVSTRVSSLQFSSARWPMKHASLPGAACRIPLEWKLPWDFFFCTGAAGFGSMVAVCAEGTSRVEFRWEYVR